MPGKIPPQVHYSLKWQYKHNAAATLSAFREFCQNVAEYESCSVLLVSGGGKKRKVDSSTVSMQQSKFLTLIPWQVGEQTSKAPPAT